MSGDDGILVAPASEKPSSSTVGSLIASHPSNCKIVFELGTLGTRVLSQPALRQRPALPSPHPDYSRH